MSTRSKQLTFKPITKRLGAKRVMRYQGEYIAYTDDDRVIAHDKELLNVAKTVEDREGVTFAFVPDYHQIRILAVCR